MTFDLAKLSADSGELIVEYNDNVPVIQVRETEHFRWLYTGGVVIQSIMNINAPETILLPVPKALLLSTLWLPQLPNQSSDVLNLGVGGGTIERALAKNKQVKITSVEADQNIINIARQYFHFPKHNIIIESCALDFLSKNEANYELIFIDLFNAEIMPTFCFSISFYQLLSTRLSTKGILSINLHPKNENELLNILLLNKALFSNIALIKFEHYQNIVLLLSHQFIPNQEELRYMNKNTNNLLGIDFNEVINNVVYVNNPQ